MEIKGGMNMKELIMNNMEFIVTFTTMVVVWILGRISKKSKKREQYNLNR